MYSAAVVKYKESALLNKLRYQNVKIKPPEPTLKKKYRDWTGKYYKTSPQGPPSAYNRPLKRIVYDSWADTRAIWIKP